MKKILVSTLLAASAAVQASPNVIYTFGSTEMEEFFKEKRYVEIVKEVSKELFGSAGDSYTIAFIGDYSQIDNGSKCLYSINAFVGKQYKNYVIMDTTQTEISRSMGVKPIKECSTAVDASFQFVIKNTLTHIREQVEAEKLKNIPKTNPKTHRTL